VPFLVQWKGGLPAGTVYEQPVIQLDLLPTAVAAAGAEVRADWKLDGVNLLPHLRGKATGRPHETLYWRFGPQWAIRQGNWKLVQGFDYTNQKQAPVHQTKVTPVMLFDLADDPSETKDLAARHPERVQALQTAWGAWNKELAEPAWIPQPAPKKGLIPRDLQRD